MGGLFLKKILQISVCERRICSAHGSGFNSAKDFLEICARDRGFSHLEGKEYRRAGTMGFRHCRLILACNHSPQNFISMLVRRAL